jgi:hypothetical protein
MERLMDPDTAFREALHARHSLAAIYKRRRTMDEEGMQKADDMFFPGCTASKRRMKRG